MDDRVTVKTRDNQYFYLKSGHWEGNLFMGQTNDGTILHFPRESVLFVRFYPEKESAKEGKMA